MGLLNGYKAFAEVGPVAMEFENAKEALK